MSDAGNLFAIATPRGTNIDNISTGGAAKISQLKAAQTRSRRMPSLTQSDIAHAMSKGSLAKQPWLLAQVKYLDDLSKTAELERALLFPLAVDLAIKYSIKTKKELLRTHAICAIQEIVNLNRCGACNGKGQIWVRECSTCKGKEQVWVRECSPCKGKGVISITQEQLADMSSMSRTDWGRKLKPLYHELISELQNWESTAIAHVKRYIK